MIVGYATGVFDLFHIGHLNFLRNARSLCDQLIVGVTVDDMVGYKNKKCVIPFEERIEIVRNMRWVDAAIPQSNMDKVDAWKKLKYDVLFVGDDWYQTKRWSTFEDKLKEQGVKVVYFPYTQGVSSTLRTKTVQKLHD